MSATWTPQGEPVEGVREPIRLTFDGTLRIGGAPVFAGGIDDLTAEVLTFAVGDSPQLVVTPNVDHVINLTDDPVWREVFDSAALRVIDGAPVERLAHRLGAVAVERLPGADLLPHFAQVVARRGLTMAVTGGSPDALERGVARLRAAYPGGRFEAVPFPIIDSVDDPRSTSVIDHLTSVAPHIVFLCLGSPKQEKWFSEWRAMLPPGVYFGAGASIDFIAGHVRRAPLWMRRAGLEWAWRVAQEPRRLFFRYFVKGPRFLRIAWRSVAARSEI